MSTPPDDVVARYWLESFDVQGKIIKLRDTSGRSPAEAETALRLAAKLEGKFKTEIRPKSKG